MGTNVNLLAEHDGLVGQDVALLGSLVLDDFVIGGVVLEPGDEVDAFIAPAAKHGIIYISPVDDHNGALGKSELLGHIWTLIRPSPSPRASI